MFDISGSYRWRAGVLSPWQHKYTVVFVITTPPPPKTNLIPENEIYKKQRFKKKKTPDLIFDKQVKKIVKSYFLLPRNVFKVVLILNILKSPCFISFHY